MDKDGLFWGPAFEEHMPTLTCDHQACIVEGMIRFPCLRLAPAQNHAFILVYDTPEFWSAIRAQRTIGSMPANEKAKAVGAKNYKYHALITPMQSKQQFK